jgi:hypothetical protein
MRAALTVLACAVAVPAAARAAPPTQDDLDARAKALTDKLGGQGFAVVVEPPFVVIGDEPVRAVKHHADGFMRWTIGLLEKDYFAKRPDKLIEVYLFKDERSYRRNAKRLFGDDPDTPYGYYSSDHDALIMNFGSGAGTLSHELVHPYMEANFPGVPAWFNEGLASLYEYPSEKSGHIVGLPNWRLPNLKTEIRAGTLPDLATLLGTSDDEFYKADYDAYAYARYLLYYLQEHGKLLAFYQAFRADTADRTGKSALEAVLGEDLASFEPGWRRWVLAIKR